MVLPSQKAPTPPAPLSKATSQSLVVQSITDVTHAQTPTSTPLVQGSTLAVARGVLATKFGLGLPDF
jgi:hypothetical protein